jgi:hypothetical protein
MVHEHAEMDELRKTECLCRRCSRLKEPKADNCPVAQSLYEICDSAHIAMSITRCPQFEARQ